MAANPLTAPPVSTAPLIITSALTGLCLIYLTAALTANWPPLLPLIVAIGGFLTVAAALGIIWTTRIRRRRLWSDEARKRWAEFDQARQLHGTTTEITVLSVDALEPTGSWVTIRWNRFNHVQQAWLEALPEPIWPGATMLFTPDAEQIKVGLPWPHIYYLWAKHFHAWAPEAVSGRDHARLTPPT